jgi:hypothetical protein
MFHLTQKYSKGLWALFALVAVLVSLFSALLITANSVHAADQTPKKTPCVGNNVTTGYKSPFSKTSDMCIGDGQAGTRYYQFAVKLSAAIDVNVSARSGNGTSISFVKQSDTLYVSKPASNNGGYVATTMGTSPACNTKDKNNIITIATKGPGTNNTDTKEINLCSYKGNVNQSLVYQSASVKDASGTPTSQTGTIRGNLGVERTEAIVPDNQKKATLNKDYVTSLVLTGPTNIANGSGRSPVSSAQGNGFNLSNGKLDIEGLKPGTYKLKIVYNDLAAIQAAGGDPGWTKEVTMDFANIVVRAGEDSWISKSSATTVLYASTDPNVNNDQSAAEDTPSTCNIEGVGWILCPMMTFMGGIVDGAYSFVSSLLVVQPLLTTGNTQPVYITWGVMRNIANVAFVIAFLFIIFSQLTGMGVSNYGVKKLLPRIVVAAILVNVSFWICAIAVDLSNIIGASVITLFEAADANIANALSTQIGEVGSVFNGGNTWTNLVGTVIGGGIVVGALYYVGLSALIPALLAAVVAIVTVFLVLTLRQALIILLIVVSPLAFVAYLLPNTEDLFTRWRKLLMTLLLMYPIIAGLFGASALASSIIMNGSDNIVVQIMGACIAILPLAITPLVMKTAGGLLNRFGGIVNNTERGPVDRLKKVGAGYRDTRNTLRNTRALNGQKQFGRGTFVKWRSQRNAIASGVKSQSGRVEQQYIANSMTTQDANGVEQPTAFANKVAGGGGRDILGQTIAADPAALQRALAGAKFTIEKAEMDDVKAEQSLISNLDMTSLTAALTNSKSTARTAAVIDRMITIGEPKNYEAAVNQYGSDKSEGNSTVRQTIAGALRERGPQFLKASDLDNISTGNLGGKTLSSMAQTNIKQGVYSQEKLVSEAAVNIKYAYEQADPDGKKAMFDTASELKVNETLKGKIKHNVLAIDNLAEKKDPITPRPTRV